jgi:uncharacterized protein YjbJ (UPF0337 family)
MAKHPRWRTNAPGWNDDWIRKEMDMAQDMLKGSWKQLKGNVKKQWGKLTDDDMMEIEGNKDVLIGKLQQRYGYSKTEAEKDYQTWLAAQGSERNSY